MTTTTKPSLRSPVLVRIAFRKAPKGLDDDSDWGRKNLTRRIRSHGLHTSVVAKNEGEERTLILALGDASECDKWTSLRFATVEPVFTCPLEQRTTFVLWSLTQQWANKPGSVFNPRILLSNLEDYEFDVFQVEELLDRLTQVGICDRYPGQLPLFSVSHRAQNLFRDALCKPLPLQPPEGLGVEVAFGHLEDDVPVVVTLDGRGIDLSHGDREALYKLAQATQCGWVTVSRGAVQGYDRALRRLRKREDLRVGEHHLLKANAYGFNTAPCPRILLPPD